MDCAQFGPCAGIRGGGVNADAMVPLDEHGPRNRNAAASMYQSQRQYQYFIFRPPHSGEVLRAMCAYLFVTVYRGDRAEGCRLRTCTRMGMGMADNPGGA